MGGESCGRFQASKSKLARQALIFSIPTPRVGTYAVEEEAAKALARQNGCFKCHSVSKKMDGPAYKDVAAKYKGKANAEARLIEHITTGEKAKFEDGHEEEHKIIKTKDMNEIKNLVNWILLQ